MSSALLPDPSDLEGVPPIEPTPIDPTPVAPTPLASPVAGLAAEATPSPSTARHLVSGTSTLALGVVLERGAGFAANILAFRLGGAGTFGAYALAVTTANNIATYAAAGIGATAARFSGKYRFGTVAYPTLARALAIVSVVSAVAASVFLYLGAPFLARLLRQPHLTGLLHWAALSAAGAILLECARGFFVGQRRLRALVTLSLAVGCGMLTLLPIAAAHRNATAMIMAQGGLTVGAVVLCLLFASRLGLRHEPDGACSEALPLGPMVREVWGFGSVQLAGLVGANLAGWWLTTLVARGDGTLAQMGFFAIASQLRNMVGLAPGLLTEGSYAVMADPEGEQHRTPQFVLGLTTFGACACALLLAGVGVVAAPVLLRVFYNSANTQAALTVSVALALAVVHMGNAPASARLSILSIRTSGVINSLWAIAVAGAGTLLMLHGGSSAEAMAIYLGAHALSSGLVLLSLAHRRALPRGLLLSFALATGTALLLVALALLRARRPETAVSVSLGMGACVVVSLAVLLLHGRRRGWTPSRAAIRRLVRAAADRLRRPSAEVRHA